MMWQPWPLTAGEWRNSTKLHVGCPALGHPLPNCSPSITWIRSSSAIIAVMHQTLMTCSNNVVGALREPVEALLLLPIHLKNTQAHLKKKSKAKFNNCSSLSDPTFGWSHQSFCGYRLLNNYNALSYYIESRKRKGMVTVPSVGFVLSVSAS